MSSDITIPIRITPDVRTRLAAGALSHQTSINGLLAMAASQLTDTPDTVVRRGSRANKDREEKVTRLTLRLSAAVYANLQALSEAKTPHVPISTLVRDGALKICDETPF